MDCVVLRLTLYTIEHVEIFLHCLLVSFVIKWTLKTVINFHDEHLCVDLQIIRSVGQWSAGTGHTEESIHNAYFSVIEKAEHFVYIEVRIYIILCLIFSLFIYSSYGIFFRLRS